MKQLSNYDKAVITFIAIQERKKNERVQLHEEATNHSLEVAKLAKKKDKEATEYSIDNVARVKRRMR